MYYNSLVKLQLDCLQNENNDKQYYLLILNILYLKNNKKNYGNDNFDNFKILLIYKNNKFLKIKL